ncbi:MAG: hypothetical protein HY516_03420 [Candidatus Aenigmarchaeota archaeon]|nr:hypothetical protein [Candidatus Aenigmarchaeota archaeon]
MPSIKEESKELMRALFSTSIFQGYADRFDGVYNEIKDAHSLQGKPKDQVLVAFGVFEYLGPRSAEEAMELVFPPGVEHANLHEVYERTIAGRKIFEMQYDSDGLPVSYRPHKNGRHGWRDENGVIHTLETGIEKGDFIGYAEISDWIRQNK